MSGKSPEVDFSKPTFSWVGYRGSSGAMGTMVGYAVNADDADHAVNVGITRAAKDGYTVDEFTRIETSELHTLGEGDDNGDAAE